MLQNRLGNISPLEYVKGRVKTLDRQRTKTYTNQFAIVHLSDSYDPKIKENVSARIALKALAKRNHYTTTGTLST